MEKPTQAAPAAEVRSEGGGDISWKAVLMEIALTAVSYCALYYGAMQVVKLMDPNNKDKEQAKVNKKAWTERLAKSGRQYVPTNEYEDIIAQDMVNADDIQVKLEDIGGLGGQKQAIYELAILPLRRPDLFRGQGGLISAPKGILLYGAPGTGKTMLAKAVAKESGATFIDLKMSTVMNKWFGESQKLIRAVFSLANKLAPTIIFIDEIDSFMRSRGGEGDTAAMSNMKAEFMALWDGMLSDNNTTGGTGYGVIVLGATNRPYDVDAAILRRMPRTFEIGLPDQRCRAEILKLILHDTPIDFKDADYITLAIRTPGYSGSDLKELCRAAAMAPVRDFMKSVPKESQRKMVRQAQNTEPEQKPKLRPLTMSDFDTARRSVLPTGETAAAYQQKEEQQQQAQNPFANINLQQMLFQMFQAAAAQQQPQVNPSAATTKTKTRDANESLD